MVSRDKRNGIEKGEVGMKKKYLLSVLVFAFCIFATSFGYSHTRNFINLATGDSADTRSGRDEVEGRIPADKDKGSFMHAWQAIVNAGLKKGDVFTVADFEKMRNWSKSTRGYELKAGVLLGIWKPTGKKEGEYELLVDATSEQINEINNAVQNIVNRKGVHGEALGIDAHRLDAAWLGKGDIQRGMDVLHQIQMKIREILRENYNMPTITVENAGSFVDETLTTQPACVVIQEERPFSIGNNITSETLRKSDVNPHAVLSALVDMGLVSPEATRTPQGSYSFNEMQIGTVLFKGEFVMNKSQEFKRDFERLTQDQIAVIIANIGEEKNIRAALEEVGLLDNLGERIIVMSVKGDSPSAVAFARLFGDKNSFDLRDQKLEDALKNRDLVKGLEGAV